MICKDCYYKKDIGNTDETGAAICTYPHGFEPINVNNECKFSGDEQSLAYIVDITKEVQGV